MTVQSHLQLQYQCPRLLSGSLRIVECPALVIFGDEVYLNKVEIVDAEFYRRLAHLPKGARLPTTAQPTPRQFTEAIEQVKAEGASSIVITTVSAKLSGTHNSAVQAAELEQDLPVFVWDTASASLGGGWQTIVAAEMALAGASFEDSCGRLARHSRAAS